MRIRVSDILEMLAENVLAEEILTDFPDLESNDIQACLLFADHWNLIEIWSVFPKVVIMNFNGATSPSESFYD